MKRLLSVRCFCKAVTFAHCVNWISLFIYCKVNCTQGRFLHSRPLPLTSHSCQEVMKYSRGRCELRHPQATSVQWSLYMTISSQHVYQQCPKPYVSVETQVLAEKKKGCAFMAHMISDINMSIYLVWELCISHSLFRKEKVFWENNAFKF